MPNPADFKCCLDEIGVAPSPLAESCVSGLTIEYHARPGIPAYSMLALTYTSSLGLIRHRPWRPRVEGFTWDWVLETSPCFVRSQIAGMERAGVWEQDHHAGTGEPGEMNDEGIYVIRIKNATHSRLVCLIQPNVATTASAKRLAKVLYKLMERGRDGFAWRAKVYHAIHGRA